jgi:hypothetical protein
MDGIYQDLDMYHCEQECRELSRGGRPKRRAEMWTEDEAEMKASKRKALGAE